MKYGFLLILIIVVVLFMIYNNKNDQFVFIHVPKNAGTSMKALLTDKNSDIPIKYVGHNYPKKYKNEIAVIRDPINRLISAFYYDKQMWENKFNNQFETPNEFVEAWADSQNPKHDIAKIMVSNKKEMILIRNSNAKIKIKLKIL